MTLTIPMWLIWVAVIILGIPAICLIAFCVWFTWTWHKYTKRGWYI